MKDLENVYEKNEEQSPRRYFNYNDKNTFCQSGQYKFQQDENWDQSSPTLLNKRKKEVNTFCFVIISSINFCFILNVKSDIFAKVN